MSTYSNNILKDLNSCKGYLGSLSGERLEGETLVRTAVLGFRV